MTETESTQRSEDFPGFKYYIDIWFNAGKIHFWWADHEGVEHYNKIPYRCYCYETAPNGTVIDMNSRKGRKKYFKNHGDCVKYVVENRWTTFGYYPPEQQFLMDNFIDYHDDPSFKMVKFRKIYIDIETFSRDDGGFSTPEDPEGFIGTIGIYDEEQNVKYCLMYCSDFSNNGNSAKTKDWDGIEYHKVMFKNELEMLKWMVRYIRKNNINGFVGFNSRRFDLPYIINRMRRLGASDAQIGRMSETGIVRFQEWDSSYKVPGMVQFDYQDLYLKYSYGDVEEKNLGHISMIELGESKTPAIYPFHCMSMDGKITDRKKYADMIKYQMQDVRLVYLLEEKLSMIKLSSSIYTRGMAVPEKIYNTIPYIDGSIAMDIRKQGFYPPNYKKYDESRDQKFEGALTLDPTPGRKGWSSVYDAKSMYPSSIMACNISPETKFATILGDMSERVKKSRLIRPFFDWEEEDNSQPITLRMHNGDYKDTTIGKIRNLVKQYNLVVSGNGVLYKTGEVGIIPKLLSNWFGERIGYQKSKLKARDEGDEEAMKYYDLLQYSTKIMLNSVYGALGSTHSSYYDLDNALSTTKTAQDILRMAMYLANEWKRDNGVNYKSIPFYRITREYYPDSINYGDTDSIFVKMDDMGVDTGDREDDYQLIEDKSMDLEKYMEDKFEPWAKEWFNSDNGKVIQFALEAIADVSVMNAAKKYVMNLVNDDGKINLSLTKPKLKVKGIEIVSASTPYDIKPMLREMVRSILFNKYSDVCATIRSNYDKFMKMRIDQVAKPTGVKNLEKYDGTINAVYDEYGNLDYGSLAFKEHCPYHVKASLFFNYCISQNPNGHKPISEGNKVKLMYIKPVDNFNCIAFTERWPEELGLVPDYHRHAETVFTSMPKKFFEALNWSFPNLRTNDIMDLFE